MVSIPSQCSVLPLLGGGVFGFVARVREIAQGLEIILRQRHEGFATPRPAPAIALDAADEPLAGGRSRSEGVGSGGNCEYQSSGAVARQAARSSSEASSLSGLFTRVETGHITMSSAVEQIGRVGCCTEPNARKPIWGG